MAIWQFRLILLPEKVLLAKYDILPSAIPLELAEDFAWWSDAQPSTNLERQIDLILPKMDSWSTSMRMWGQKDRNDAYICYVNEDKNTVEEIAFRIDARAISEDLVRDICRFARKLGCVLMTADYKILQPDEAMVWSALDASTAKKFVDDPISTLQNLDTKKIEEQANDQMKLLEKNRRRKK